MCRADDFPPYQERGADDDRAAFLAATRGVTLTAAVDLVYDRLASIGQCGYPRPEAAGYEPNPNGIGGRGTCACGQVVYFDSLAPLGGEWRHLPGSCNQSGHAQLGCNGSTDVDLHGALNRDGIGWSSVPGPSMSEAVMDPGIVADEYHGRDPRAG